MGPATLRQPAHRRRTCAPPARKNRGTAGRSAIPDHRARIRLPLRGADLTARIFIKIVLGAFCLLAVAMSAVDYFAARVVESSYIQNLTNDMAGKAAIIARTLPGAGDGASGARGREIARDAGGRLTMTDRGG